MSCTLVPSMRAGDMTSVSPVMLTVLPAMQLALQSVAVACWRQPVSGTHSTRTQAVTEAMPFALLLPIADWSSSNVSRSKGMVVMVVKLGTKYVTPSPAPSHQPREGLQSSVAAL